MCSMTERIRRLLLNLARLGLGLSLLAYIVARNNPRQAVAQFLAASWPQLAGALGLYLAATMLIAFRWHLVLRARAVHVGLVPLTRFYLIGFFFNNFLPSSVGGDVMRIWNLAACGCPASLSLSSVFVERLMGFLAMAMLALLSMVYMACKPSPFRGDPLLVLTTAGLTIAFLGVLLVSFNRRAAAVLSVVFARFHWRSLGAKFQRVYDAIHEFRDYPGMLAAVFAVSLVYQMVMGFFTWWVMSATGLHTKFTSVFALTQISCMVGVLPVTFDGLGLREWIFVHALGAAGHAPAAVSPAIIMARLVSLVGSLVGGLLFVRGEHRPAPLPAEARI